MFLLAQPLVRQNSKTSQQQVSASLLVSPRTPLVRQQAVTKARRIPLVHSMLLVFRNLSAKMDLSIPNSPFKWNDASGLGESHTTNTSVRADAQTRRRRGKDQKLTVINRAQLFYLSHEDEQPQSQVDMLRHPLHPVLPIPSDNACHWYFPQLHVVYPDGRDA